MMFVLTDSNSSSRNSINTLQIFVKFVRFLEVLKYSRNLSSNLLLFLYSCVAVNAQIVYSSSYCTVFHNQFPLFLSLFPSRTLDIPTSGKVIVKHSRRLSKVKVLLVCFYWFLFLLFLFTLFYALLLPK